MNIHFTSHYPVPQLSRIFCRRLLIDVLPTVLLLLAMACAMAFVASYADAVPVDMDMFG
ncbi:MAG: hypothetical protein L3J63_08555 [Geopsychrobacter sp.]|nr:hypothetical protein [Geopsychrobacter sp.]